MIKILFHYACTGLIGCVIGEAIKINYKTLSITDLSWWSISLGNNGVCLSLLKRGISIPQNNTYVPEDEVIKNLSLPLLIW